MNVFTWSRFSPTLVVPSRASGNADFVFGARQHGERAGLLCEVQRTGGVRLDHAIGAKPSGGRAPWPPGGGDRLRRKAFRWFGISAPGARWWHAVEP